MPDVAPSGCLSAPLANLADLLSESATFQEWVGAADAAGALARIYLSPVSAWTFPLASIEYLPKGGWRNEWIGQPNTFMTDGTMELIFAAEVPEAYQPDDQQRNASFWMRNKVGAIVDEMREIQASGRFVTIGEISLFTEGRTEAQYRKLSDGSHEDVMEVYLHVNFRQQAVDEEE